MRKSLVLVSFLAVLAGVAGLAAAYSQARPAAAVTVPAAGQPRVQLAVLVVFDQLRGDYLETWRGLFGNRGFVRLQTEGAWFTHCNYPYATTTTGPGHSSMLTGTCPDRHGIINNGWFEGGTVVTAAGSPARKTVGAKAESASGDVMVGISKTGDAKPKPKESGSPERLLAETVADVLRTRHPNTKTFGLSLKERSAILPVGKRATGAFWFEGRFITSDYYADTLPPWVASFNAAGDGNVRAGANRWFGQDWVPGREALDYFHWLDPVVAAFWKATPGSPAFRHPNTGGKAKPGKEYYDKLATSPCGNEILLDLAESCITSERLGQRNVPDLLVVSFSSNDLIGHTYGPDSPEVLDVTLESDDVMARLLEFLDAQVGRGKYVMAVTADHGICPVVRVSEKRGNLEAARVSIKGLQTEIEAHLNARFGLTAEVKAGTKRPLWIEAFGGTFPWIYFNKKLLAATGTSPADAARATAGFLNAHADVAHAYTRAELTTGPPRTAIDAQVRRSFHPQRSGDIYVLLKPYCIPLEGYLETGTTHGSPYYYDTHVPLLVYGPGIAGGVRKEAVTPQATAAIFSTWLGLPLPNQAEFPVPTSLVSD